MKQTTTSKWILDAVMMSIFLLAFFLDLTGLELHQWLGIAAAALAVYHLVTRWSWVSAVGQRFFGKTSNQARLYLVIDTLLLGGFALIGLTGLVISTWLNLSLSYYPVWLAAHILASIGTLGLLVLKLALHTGWIATTARKLFARNTLAPQARPSAARQAAPSSIGWAPVPASQPHPAPTPTTSAHPAQLRTAQLQPAPARPAQPHAQPGPVASAPAAAAAARERQALSRRDFLKVMGVVGGASFVALASAGSGLVELVTTTGASSSAASLVTTTGASSSAASSIAPNAGATSAGTTAGTTAAAPGSPSPASTASAETNSQLPASPSPASTATPNVSSSTASNSSGAAQSSGSSSSSTLACRGSCPRNEHCSFPGRCRKYRDSDGNGRCDLGECA